MEPKFQTSFIPKKPLMPQTGMAHPAHHSRGTSLYMAFAVILFLASLGAVGGAYAWKQILISTQNSYKNDLAAREQQFDLDQIEQLQQADVKINLAEQLLANHVAASQIFAIISHLTIQNVRFTSLDLALSTPSTQSGTNGDTVTMNGYASNFSAVAFQSDVLNELSQYGLSKIVINPMLTNPALSSNGTVSFGFSATIAPSSLTYANALAPAAAPASAPSGATTSPSGASQ